MFRPPPSPASSHPFSVLLLVMVVGLLFACTPEAERETEARTVEAERSIDQALDRVEKSLEKAGSRMETELTALGEEMEPRARDAALTARVKARLTAHPDVNPFEIDVDTSDGRVTLSGVVESDADRRAAEEIARNTEGVVAVDNQLEVGPRG